MVWTPRFKIIKSRVIADNLLAYIAANQADAILWAGGSALRSIKSFSNSVANRAVPVYPSIMFVDDEDAQDYTEDITPAAYQLVFEILVQNAAPNTAVSEARVYAAAIVSMIRNCPPATVSANTGANVNATVLQSVECGFEEIKTNEMQNDFLQGFQIRAIYNLMASAYE